MTQETKVLNAIASALKIAAEHTLVKRLAERRISPGVIATFDIQTRGDGWTYPTPQGALRFKSASSQGAKYAWLKGKDTLLYGQDLLEAVELADSDIWLTTEFDFFAMHSAGVSNVIAQMQGEGSVPRDLAPKLQSMGVLVCHIAPDRDKTGEAWAQLVADELVPAGIEVYSRELPFAFEENHGGDLGLLWQQYTGKQEFDRHLRNLPVKHMQATERPSIIETVRTYEISGDIKDDIANRLKVFGYKASGYSKPLNCPFHNDHTLSANLHKDFGLHCFTEDHWYRWKELAEHFGMAWSVSSSAIAPQLSRPMLGDEVLEAMIAAGFSVLAYTVETAYRAGWGIGRQFTRKQLETLVSRYRARLAVDQMEGRRADLRKLNSRGRRGKREGEIMSGINLFLSSPEEELIPDTNSPHRATGKRRGPKGKVYRLPSPAEIARVFGVQPEHYAEIALRRSLPDWRAELMALKPDRDPGSWTNAELAKEQRMSTSTVQSYRDRAHMSWTPQYAPRVEVHSADELPDTPDLKATWLEADDGHRDCATKRGYERLSKRGRVWLVKRLANLYGRRERR